MSTAQQLGLEGKLEDIQQDRQQGIQRGIEETKLTMAKFMFKRGIDTNLIQDITGLDKCRIEEIKKELEKASKK